MFLAEWEIQAMRISRTTPWLLALCMATAGCQLASNGVHNLAYEAKLAAGDAAEHCRYEKLAATYWAKVENCSSGRNYSHDYARGFKDGFVDFVEYGGTGQPPDVPPKHYWGAHYRTPEGYRAIEDWYAGFRHGATAAHESGQRQWATVPAANATEHSATERPAPAPEHPAPAPSFLPPSANRPLAPAAQNVTIQVMEPQAAPAAAPVVAPCRRELGQPSEASPLPDAPQVLFLRPTLAPAPKAATLAPPSLPAEISYPPNSLGNPEPTAAPTGSRGWVTIK